jgi:hypothetical protein
MAGTGFVGGTTLASAPPGQSRGRAVLGGVLTLKIPASTAPGTYNSVLTVTVL